MKDATALSFRGTRAEVKAVRAVAAVRGVKVADLTREILFNTYGDEIRRYLVDFAAQDGDKNHQLMIKQTTQEPTHANR